MQVVSQHSSLLAPIAVDAVLRVTEPGKEQAVDLKVSILINKNFINYVFEQNIR